MEWEGWGVIGSPVLFHLANFGWENEIHHLITSHKKYASYLSLYCPFAWLIKAQGANHFWLTP